MSSEVRVRFAPSPTGHLHVGNARTALFNWLFARHHSGMFVLRIEDTDAERSTRASDAAILEDLRWLGLDWDEGPEVGGGHGPYRQSERGPAYAAAASRLLGEGAAYRCFCSTEVLAAQREAQRAAGLPPRYDGTCRSLEPAASERRAVAEPFVLRFRITADHVAFEDLIRGRVEFPGSQLGDPVIVRADGSPTYNFAVVVDDLEMRITHVIRGEDHLSNTPRQILLYQAFGSRPPAFAHVSMVLGPDGSPLSKRHGASSVADFREKGFLPDAMVNYLVLLGWAHPEGRETLAREEIVRAFSLKRVGHAAAMFDMKKLLWLNAHHLRGLDAASMAAACREGLVREGYLPEAPADLRAEGWAAQALQVFAGQMETLADAPHAVSCLFAFEDLIQRDAAAGRALEALAGEPSARAVVERFADAIASMSPPLLLDRSAYREAAAQVGRGLGVKGRQLYHPIRVAMTAAEQGPELDRLVPLIDEGSQVRLPSPVMPCIGRARLVAELLRRRA